jgi:isopentenyl-diphosphate delta-isomerase
MSDSELAGAEELVVLVDDHGQELGTAAKASVHHQMTPLHLGFSCYVFDADGRVLLTRRALSKRTWPGVWTNSFCGHPAPGEPIADAVHRRARQELGLTIGGRTIAADGTVENELCPVFSAIAVSPLWPAPDEVMDHTWTSWRELRTAAELCWTISPWAADQIPLFEAAICRGRGPNSSASTATPSR